MIKVIFQVFMVFCIYLLMAHILNYFIQGEKPVDEKVMLKNCLYMAETLPDVLVIEYVQSCMDMTGYREDCEGNKQCMSSKMEDVYESYY